MSENLPPMLGVDEAMRKHFENPKQVEPIEFNSAMAEKLRARKTDDRIATLERSLTVLHNNLGDAFKLIAELKANLAEVQGHGKGTQA